ncbi:MAG: von Willebrand factor type A domain-containing protein [Pedobacter sp.]|uniref:vWA domain-containing protein n=1 Tax=Pedobacter sp. TaxID=1411316 RepID=UPI002807A90E|nr:von Willebrand factor type A domain-containing protein [Pedobacter sp.]MDQ8004484.1 von Willebrand factor type A domain-containing protein [Pedobacter sp.]
MKTLFTSIIALILLLGYKANPTREISGTIVSASDGLALPGTTVKSLPSKTSVSSDKNGKYKIVIPSTDTHLQVMNLGFVTKKITIGKTDVINIKLDEDNQALKELVVVGYGKQQKRMHKSADMKMVAPPVAEALAGRVVGISANKSIMATGNGAHFYQAPQNTENYAHITENAFKKVTNEPLSTFSIDVDAASYSNMRRFINNGGLPPKDAVRIEEMINYFDYSYAQPKGDDPVNIVTEIGTAPWNSQHRLVHIGLKAKNIPTEKLPPSNLVFLIDVSGSMESYNKLPLLVSSLRLLTDNLRDQDKVAIVVYAGSSGLVLPSTSGDNKQAIKEALSKLSAGGSTAGGAGIKLAYKVATENFIKGGNNRIILATDGDFNVGASSDGDMQTLIEEKRKSGVFLTVLGFGMGNYKDSKMEVLANKGNGNYAYIDNISEARKVLINEFGGTLFTVAKDVKLQIEFNPAKVQAYRLIGYENRLLNNEDFNDDKKDAGEMGAGHTVTALYEIIPVGVESKFIKSVDALKYQDVRQNALKNSPSSNNTNEILTVKMRYKQPDGDSSKLLQKPVIDSYQDKLNKTSDNFRFSASVAMFGMLLRQSEFVQESTFEQAIALADGAKGTDKEGYRAEYVKLAKSAQLMAKDLRNFATTGKEK